MKTILVHEVIAVRAIDESITNDWSPWKVCEGDFDTVVEEIKELSSEGTWATFQIAKFYYDENDEYVAWDCGVKVCMGQIV